MRKLSVLLGLVFALCLLAGCAYAATPALSCQIGSQAGAQTHVINVSGDNYLFLPACARALPLTLYTTGDSALALTGGGQTLPLQAGQAFMLPVLPADASGDYALIITAGGETTHITVMVSENIASLFFLSENPAAQGRAWIEASPDHSRTAAGSAVMLRADGSPVYNGELSEIRGRGNSTWSVSFPKGTAREGDYKRPYQIKLQTKTDLMDTGNDREANRRWVLLADAFDSTLLHNRIVLDLGLELGLQETSHSRPVDLYYDGEYRGLYLLAEKVEVGSGRVEITDYEELLESWNVIEDKTTLMQRRIATTNRYGDPVYAIDGIDDAGEATLGGYLVEFDKAYAMLEPSYFQLYTGQSYAIHHPKYPSTAMAVYVSERFHELSRTLEHEGVHPDTGQLWDSYFDLDALLPYFWINEWAKNGDVWRYSSTFFTLPEQGGKLRMGPLWDFDLSFYTKALPDGTVTMSEDLIAITAKGNIGYNLLHISGFQTLAAAYYTDRFLPVINNIVLGDEQAQGAGLHSLAWYWQEEAASRRMNDVLWNPVSVFGYIVAPTYAENYQALRAFIQTRTAWLAEETRRWLAPVPLDTIDITLRANYANAANTLLAVAQGPYGKQIMIDQAYTKVQGATETDFALWKGELRLSTEIGYRFADQPTLLVNGAQVPYQTDGDGRLTAEIWFEDISYRPAVYKGSDYGLAFDADYYREAYPDLAAEYSNDPAQMLAHYVEFGTYEGQQANAYFDPQEVLQSLPDVKGMLGEHYEDVVFFYLEAGYVDWMSRLGKTSAPAVFQSPPAGR